MIWNPRPHMLHAWEETRSSYGRAALVVFYVWLWYNIVMSFVSLVSPGSQGVQCYLDEMNEVGKTSFLGKSGAMINLRKERSSPRSYSRCSPNQRPHDRFPRLR